MSRVSSCSLAALILAGGCASGLMEDATATAAYSSSATAASDTDTGGTTGEGTDTGGSGGTGGETTGVTGGTTTGATTGLPTTGLPTTGGSSSGGSTTGEGSCEDGIQNGGEEGVDCNGPCEAPCILGDQQEVSDEVPIVSTDAHPAVAGAINGEKILVVWSKVNAAGGTFHIRGRMLDPDGTPAEPSFAIGDDIHPASRQGPRVAAHNVGYWVTWMQNDDVDGWDVHARRLDFNGTLLGSEIIVNTTTAGSQYGGDLDANPDGSAVVCWGPGSIRCQRFDVSGAKIGVETKIETTTAGDQRSPSVALRPDGSFFVAWESCEGGSGTCGDDGTDTGRWVVRGQMMSSADTPTPVGGELLLSTASEHAYLPDLAGDSWGGMVAVWTEGPWHQGNAGMGDTGPFSGSYAVTFQRFDTDGSPTGSVETVTESPVGQESIYDRVAPSVTMFADGEFVVAWRSDDPSVTVEGTDIVARRFFEDGMALGQTFLVQSTDDTKNTKGNQSSAQVAVVGAEQVVFTWVGSQDTHVRAFNPGL